MYSDALNRLADNLHYLNSSGDKTQVSTRFWFDTPANLRREMGDRKRRFDDKTEVRGKIAEVIKRVVGSGGVFEGVHIFTPHGDVPDDIALRMVVLPPESWYSREEQQLAFDAVLECARNNGTKPRYRVNRLIFLAADHGVLPRLRDAARGAGMGFHRQRCEGGPAQYRPSANDAGRDELRGAEDVLPRAARECYKWLLCLVQETPTDPKPRVEAFPLNTSGGSAGGEIERVCVENELVIRTWSPIHLRTKLKELYWKEGQPPVKAMAFWEDTLRYLYLPRLKNRDVLANAIRNGAASRGFFGTAYGQSGDTFEGFQFGNASVQFDDTLLLIEPEAAKHYEASLSKTDEPSRKGASGVGGFAAAPGPGVRGEGTKGLGAPPGAAVSSANVRSFHGLAEVAREAKEALMLWLTDQVEGLHHHSGAR